MPEVGPLFFERREFATTTGWLDRLAIQSDDLAAPPMIPLPALEFAASGGKLAESMNRRAADDKDDK